jgi:hypothetical protein
MKSSDSLRKFARNLASDRVSLAFIGVLVVAAAVYVWTASTSVPLSLHERSSDLYADRYNLLAGAFVHLHLSIGRAPAAIANLANPYNPNESGPHLYGFNDATSVNDDVLYRGYLYLLWGPAPALVFLVPLRLLGFEPSASVTCAFFAVIGLGFALATLRVLVRRVGEVALWMCVLAGFSLALSSVIPFLLRTPSVSEDVIAGGYCFTMAGIWLATLALVEQRASLLRLVLMSLSFGLAAGSRAPLGLVALVLIPVFISLRPTRGDRVLLTALLAPIGGCFLLLLLYNQARFGAPLQFGTSYQLAGYDPLLVHFGSLSRLLAGMWFYTLAPLRPTVLFPFLRLTPPVSYPAALPEGFFSELTGGLLPTTPIVCFLAALPWIWRRRPAALGSLLTPLVMLACAGIASLIFVSYELFGSTERYEVDSATLLLLGSIAAWLVLCNEARGGMRRLVRIGGGILLLWGCLTGFAISFIGYGDYLATRHPGTWASLQDIGSPLSTVIARVAGRPMLGESRAAQSTAVSEPSFTSLFVGTHSFWLGAESETTFTIVSPADESTVLGASVVPAHAAVEAGVIEHGGGNTGVILRGPRHSQATYRTPPEGQLLHIPLRLSRGLNRFSIVPLTKTLKSRALEGSGERPLVQVSLALLDGE